MVFLGVRTEMRNTLGIIFILCGISTSLWGQDNPAQFIRNDGQWDGDFNHRLLLNFGAVFFEENSFTISLDNSSELHHGHHDEVKNKHEKEEDILRGHVLKVHFLYANPFPEIIENSPFPFYHNYLIGNDPSKWRSGVPVYKELYYKNLYPGIDVNFKGKGENLKYDFLVAPGGDPRLIQMEYRGADRIWIANNRLYLQTSLGTIEEFIPEAYQEIDGYKKPVKCFYELKGNLVKFKLEDYDKTQPLVIDPELVFSSFSGSPIDNWGFTATYDQNGNMYGGGVAFGGGSLQYPTSTGAYQQTYGGGSVDMAISKFSAIGDTLLYSTYLGGIENDIPHSLVVDDNNQLYILGNTGSLDFPVSPQAWQTNYGAGPKVNLRAFGFNNGSDICISKLSADGMQLLASTYLGGTDIDGINLDIEENYGDNSRGEIIYDNSRVYVVSQTHSGNVPLVNAYRDTLQGQQDVLIACFSPTLDNMIWGTYYGGDAADAGYSLKLSSTRQLVVGGSTFSDNIPIGNSSPGPQRQGSLADGFISVFNGDNGGFRRATYVGSFTTDQVFLLDLDRDDNIYAFGQTGGNISISPGVYGRSNSQQFIKKFNPALTQELWSTTIGSGSAKSDLVPTAFMVDDCYNIFLSGWNGHSNDPSGSGNPRGNTNGLPVTQDALQATTDGSDFYFMVLSRDAESLKYATYFGGTSHEHVDGGTSRFDPSGTIYQAVCAGCGNRSFPTTPGVVSETNGSVRCNLGVIKLDFETSVEALPEIDFTLDTDTVCDTLFIQLSNSSRNAQIYQWDFGNGRTSSEAEPIAFFENFGTYEIRLIAIDTNCSISDTSSIIVEHDTGTSITAAFNMEYIGCDNDFQAKFTNISDGADSYQWNFGDGASSSLKNPTHNFPESGAYPITLTAFNAKCNSFRTFTDTVYFSDTTVTPSAEIETSSCGDGSVDIKLNENRQRYTYLWNFGNGITSQNRQPYYRYEQPGLYRINLTIEDTLCGKTYDFSYPIFIEKIISEVFIPNAFSPNGDGINETLEIFGNRCDGKSEIHIFNRWGEKVFYSDRPFEQFWDALDDDDPAPVGIYTYHLINGEDEYRGSITLFR